MASAKVKDPPAEPGLDDSDFHAWTIEQAAALRARGPAALDWENPAEEIEDLGKSVFKELRSSFRIILVHMPEWDGQPERRSRSWAHAIRTQRIELLDVLDENSSLGRRQAKAYEDARLDAATEMGRSERTLPATCPYMLDEILSRPFTWDED